MAKQWIGVLLSAVLVLLLAGAALAAVQGYALDGWTVDGGGGQSAGGVDTLPSSLTYVSDSMTWSSGEGDYDQNTLSWVGPVSLSQQTTITYQATVDLLAEVGQRITNTAILADGLNPLLERAAGVQVVELPLSKAFMPLAYKGR